MLASLQDDVWHNVVHAEVGVNGVTIKQNFPKGAGTCTLNIPQDQISGATVEILPFPGPGIESSVFWLSFKVLSKPVCVFSRTLKGGQDPHSLKDFPLHSSSDKFHYLNLGLPRLKLSQKHGLTEEVYKKHLLRFTTNSPSQAPEMDEATTYLKDLMEGLVAEREAAHASLKTMNECRIVTRVLKKKVWLSIHPKGLAGYTDDDLEAKPTALQYLIRKSNIFEDDEAIIKGHPIFGTSETPGWQITIEPTKPNQTDNAAALYATVDNSFSSNLAEFDNRDEQGVTLEPIFLDIGGERARAALIDFRKMCDDDAREMAGFLAPNPEGSKKSNLPVRSLFLPRLEFDKAANKMKQGNTTVTQAWRATLNKSQSSAVAMTTQTKFSIIHGPPATGKSETIARVACEAYQADPKAKIIICGPTNTAVDECCSRINKVWGASTQSQEGPLMIVRLFSQGQIEHQFRSGPTSVYTDPTHLDARRLFVANKNPAKFSNYISGRKTLIEEHAIHNKKTMESYLRESRELTEAVLSKARIVCVTCDSLRSRLLYRVETIVDEKTGTSLEISQAWPATMCIIDEAGCANPLQILGPLVAFSKTLQRCVFAGDHKQLQPYIQSEIAKVKWGQSFLRASVDKGVDYVLLDVQHRAHERLYAAANVKIYDGKVNSFHKTECPRPYLKHLLSQLPLSFAAEGKQHTVTSYSNFINVPHGSHQSKPQGSSCNNVSTTAAEESL